MGRTHRKRKKKQPLKERNDFCNVVNLQKSLKLKCPNIKVDYFDGIGWGVRSKRHIDEGDVIIALPLDHLITADVPCGVFSLIETENQVPQFVLSTFLVYESHLGQNSKYFEYIQSLPKSFTNLYFCTEDEVEVLPDCFKNELVTQRLIIEKALSYLFQCIKDKSCPHCQENLSKIYSRERFIWAWFIVNTRSVFYEDEKLKKSLALAPFLDMFNHSDEANTKMIIDHERGLYILQTLVKYRKFEQVFIKYGAHSNFKLLLEYGFILPNNANDCVEFTLQEVLDIVKELDPERGGTTKQKYNFIKANKLDQHLVKNAEFSWNFKGLISVLTSADQNLFYTLQSKAHSNTFTSDENNLITKISETVSQRKYRQLEQNLVEMEVIDNCTESFQMAKELVKIYLNFLT